MRRRGGRGEGEVGEGALGCGRKAERAGTERRGGRTRREGPRGKEGHAQTGREGRTRGRRLPGRSGRRPRGARGGVGRRCQREAASGMQRPEAWPRPHPGEGAAAAPAGGPVPPARGREPAGLRVRSGRHRGPSGRRQLTSRPVGAGELGAARTGRGGAAPAQAEKFLRADLGGGRSGVRLDEVLEQSARAGARLGGAGLRFSRRVREPRGRPGPRADVRASGVRRAGGWGRAESAGPASAAGRWRRRLGAAVPQAQVL